MKSTHSTLTDFDSMIYFCEQSSAQELYDSLTISMARSSPYSMFFKLNDTMLGDGQIVKPLKPQSSEKELVYQSFFPLYKYPILQTTNWKTMHSQPLRLGLFSYAKSLEKLEERVQGIEKYNLRHFSINKKSVSPSFRRLLSKLDVDIMGEPFVDIKKKTFDYLDLKGISF